MLTMFYLIKYTVSMQPWLSSVYTGSLLLTSLSLSHFRKFLHNSFDVLRLNRVTKTPVVVY